MEMADGLVVCLSATERRFQGNRLSRVENLETNFRIREARVGSCAAICTRLRLQVYIQNNRLVSLAGLKTFKFLRVSW